MVLSGTRGKHPCDDSEAIGCDWLTLPDHPIKYCLFSKLSFPFEKVKEGL
jgi:hypothetical protein